MPGPAWLRHVVAIISVCSLTPGNLGAYATGSFLTTFREEEGGDVWTFGDHLVVFADSADLYSASGYGDLHNTVTDTAKKLNGVKTEKGKLSTILISSEQKRTKEYFGVKDKDLPIVMMLHINKIAAARMEEHGLQGTCTPHCTMDYYEGDTKTLDGTSVAQFAMSTTKTIKPKVTSGPEDNNLGLFRIQSNFRFIKFTPVQLRVAKMVQVSEFEFFKEGKKIPVDSVSNPNGDCPSNEGASSVIDGNMYTKWLDKNVGSLVFDMGQKVEISGYRWATGFDQPGRDPIVWTMEGTNDSLEEGTWAPLSTESILGNPEPDRHDWCLNVNVG